MADDRLSASRRIDYFDSLRVAALVAVLVRHTASQNWYDIDVNGAAWRCFNVYCSLTQYCVPVFVMISGALFLGREIPVRQIWSKYVLRMAAAFCFWSAVYAAVNALEAGTSGLLTALILGPYHIWFLFMIAGLYICLPFFRPIAADAEKSRYFLILALLFAIVLPQTETLVRDFGSAALIGRFGSLMMNINQMRMYPVLGYGGYFVLGFWMSRTELDRRQRIVIYLLGLLGALSTIWLDLSVALRTQQPCDHYYGQFTLGALLETLAVFTFFKYAGLRPNAWVRRLSEWTFGAYLVHLLIVEHTKLLFGLDTLSFWPVLAVPAVSALSLLLSLAVSAALHQIPFVKKYFV
ncbi:MAG: acyltransferase family protein [Eubacteriales bacterium]|nr:acyltransferase family protein [Eubacteriales bacterium]